MLTRKSSLKPTSATKGARFWANPKRIQPMKLSPIDYIYVMFKAKSLLDKVKKDKPVQKAAKKKAATRRRKRKESS
jgi:hypothetical protein